MRIRLLAVGSGNDGNGVRLPHYMAKRWGLAGKKVITVKAGGRTAQARLLETKSDSATIGMSRPLLAMLHLPRQIGLRARATNGVLQVGPIVGILTSGVRGLPEPFGAFSLEMSYFIQQGRRAGVLPIAFTCSGIDFKRGVVTGYTLALAETPYWVRRTIPLPDVVYDHITVRTRDRSKEIRDLRRRLAEAHIPYFNPGFFDKLETHAWLASCPELAPHLPETGKISVDNLKKVAAKYRRLFIKPARGSLGRNISVLTRTDDDGWLLRRAGRAGAQERITSLEKVSAHLPQISSGAYIVQQGLDLCRTRGRPVDVRVLMQRTDTGAWRVTKIFARVPPRGALVANITRGAKGRPIGSVMSHCFSPGRVPGIIRQVRRVALLVCLCLERTIAAPLGELGVDVGVDNEGHVWIIEVNSKPHREAYEELNKKAGARLSFQRPMLYAAFLAGFGSKANTETLDDIPKETEEWD